MYDCTSCGACCFMGFDVLLTPYEAELFERQSRLRGLVRLHVTGGGAWPMHFLRKETDGRCSALDGELGCVSCSIYADRPALCREFEVGCDECKEIRQRFGLPV